jgi:hypothetical protein
MRGHITQGAQARFHAPQSGVILMYAGTHARTHQQLSQDLEELCTHVAASSLTRVPTQNLDACMYAMPV